MKKWLVPVIIIAIIAFSLYKWAVGINNTAVTLEANAKTAWSNVEAPTKDVMIYIAVLLKRFKDLLTLKEKR